MNFDEEFLCSFLLQLRENQLVLKQLLDEEMGDSVSQSFVKKETITHDHPENYKKEYLRYKKCSSHVWLYLSQSLSSSCSPQKNITERSWRYRIGLSRHITGIWTGSS